jgi:hypothetical protein
MHLRFVHHLSLFLSLVAAVSGLPAAESQLGFNYWPHKGSSWILFDRNWPTAKVEVARDLDHMASVGTHVIRLMIWGFSHSGWVRNAPPGTGTRLTSDYQELCRNLPELLDLIVQRRMKIIVCFANPYFDHNVRGTKTREWEYAYGADGWQKYLDDSVTWMRGILDACEGSASARHIVYYDLQNEPSAHWAEERMWDLLRTIYDRLPWPKGKIGTSPMLNNAGQPGDHRKVSDVDLMKRELGERPFDYLEFHTYPRGPEQQSSNPRLADAANKLRAVYPAARLVIGEFGQKTTTSAGEKKQADWMREVTAFARDQPDVVFHLQWTLWDRLMGAADQAWGVGYDMHNPKRALGVLAELHQLLPNCDFEETARGRFPGWKMGGTVPIAAFGPEQDGPAASQELPDDPCSGDWYVRVRPTRPGAAELWVRSDPVNIAAGPGRRLYTNAYLRGRVARAWLEVREFRNPAEPPKVTRLPAIVPSAETWVNYLWGAPPFAAVQLADDTTAVSVAAVAATDARPGGLIEVDLLTADVR